MSLRPKVYLEVTQYGCIMQFYEYSHVRIVFCFVLLFCYTSAGIQGFARKLTFNTAVRPESASGKDPIFSIIFHLNHRVNIESSQGLNRT